MSGKSKILLSVLGVIVLAGVAGSCFYFYQLQEAKKIANGTAYAKDVVAVVGNQQLTDKQLQPILSGNVDRKAALACLMDVSLYEQVAKQNNIKIDNNAIEADFKSRFGTQLFDQIVFQQLCYKRNQLKLQLETGFSGTITGKALIVSFDRSIPTVNTGKKLQLNLQQQTIYNADKIAATAFMQATSKLITQKSITFDQAIKLENNDNRLGITAAPTSVHSGSFNTGSNGSTLDNFFANDPDLKNPISKMKVGDVSGIITLSIPADEVASGIGLPTNYVVIKVDSISKRKPDTLESAIARIRLTAYKVVKQ